MFLFAADSKQYLNHYNNFYNDLTNYIVAVNDTIDNVSIAAGKGTDINFSKFKSVTGWTRIIVNISFWNASSGGTGYSNCTNYAILYSSSGVNMQCRNFASTNIKIKVSVTCLYFKSELIESTTIPNPR